MALSDAFLSPTGLAALAVVVPLVLLYLVRPDPERVVLPTFRFLTEEAGRERTNPFLARLRRSLLLLLQVATVAALALALASPYVLVAEEETVSETVLVVDASASMQTATGDGTRFGRAVATAREELTGATTVVVAGAEARVALRAGTRTEAERTLDALEPTGAPGDLATAVRTATSVAGEEARVLVLSDFADDSEWSDAVRAARARGLRVALRQFGGGGADNVGVVDRSFSGTEVTLSVRNFGDAPATRTLALGPRTERLELAPGDVTTVTLPVPAGGGVARLSPADSFPVDDAVAVGAPQDATVDVLLVTSDRNRYLATALELVEPTELTVVDPLDPVDASEYDVVVFSNVDDDDLLRGNVQAAREVLEAGGGVAVQAQERQVPKLGDLLLVAPQSIKENPDVGEVADDPLTRGLTFPPPSRYVAGPLREGRPLVRLADGSPLLAVADRGAGRVLYFGYMESGSSFKFDYQYPIFWKRAVFHLAGREPLSALNERAGGRLTFGAETTVATPSGEVTATTVRLDEVGFYDVGDRRYGVGLLNPAESAVAVEPLEARSDATAEPRSESRQVPRELTWVAALGAVALVLGELGFLRRRGDL
jgi:hypothetical protein